MKTQKILSVIAAVVPAIAAIRGGGKTVHEAPRAATTCFDADIASAQISSDHALTFAVGSWLGGIVRTPLARVLDSVSAVVVARATRETAVTERGAREARDLADATAVYRLREAVAVAEVATLTAEAAVKAARKA